MFEIVFTVAIVTILVILYRKEHNVNNILGVNKKSAFRHSVVTGRYMKHRKKYKKNLRK